MANTIQGQSFPQFQALPVELQDYIWDLAVRPLPGDHHAHGFIFVDYWFDQSKGADKIQADFIRFVRKGETPPMHYGLAVPRQNSKWGPNNSAYLLDSGLWKACSASRQALERHFHRNEWWSPVSKSETYSPLPGRGDFEGQPGVSLTASYVNTNGEENHITIRPDKDLIYAMGLDPVLEMDWFYHYAGDRTLFDRKPADEDAIKSSFLGFDIAIPFATRWLDPVPSAVIDMIDILHDETGRTLWFVDHGLHRRAGLNKGENRDKEDTAHISPGSSDPEHRRKSFYGRGYKLTEVREADMHLWEINDETQSVHEFFRRLSAAHNGRLFTDGSDRLRVLAHETTP